MSLKNKWYDDNGEVYVLCKREAMQQMLRLSDKTVKKTVDALKEHAILEEDRQGWTMLNKIYLLYPTDKMGMPINPSNRRIYDSEPDNLRFINRKSSDSKPGENMIHDTEILRDRGSIAKNNTQNSKAKIVQISLKDKTITSIDVSKVIAIRIWEEGNKSGTTLITKDMNYELKPLTHYECTGLFGVTDFFICNNEFVVNKNYVSKVDYEECTLTLKNDIQLDFKIHKTKTIRQYCKGV